VSASLAAAFLLPVVAAPKPAKEPSDVPPRIADALEHYRSQALRDVVQVAVKESLHGADLPSRRRAIGLLADLRDPEITTWLLERHDGLALGVIEEQGVGPGDVIILATALLAISALEGPRPGGELGIATTMADHLPRLLSRALGIDNVPLQGQWHTWEVLHSWCLAAVDRSLKRRSLTEKDIAWLRYCRATIAAMKPEEPEHQQHDVTSKSPSD
jgi:hypothetical protein